MQDDGVSLFSAAHPTPKTLWGHIKSFFFCHWTYHRFSKDSVETIEIEIPRTGAYGKDPYTANMGNLDVLKSSMKKLLDGQ